MRKDSSPSEEDAENSPGIEEKETMADFAHRDIDKENYRHNEKERFKSSRQRDGQSSRQKYIDQHVGREIIETADSPHIRNNNSLEQKRQPAEEAGQENDSQRQQHGGGNGNFK